MQNKNTKKPANIKTSFDSKSLTNFSGIKVKLNSKFGIIDGIDNEISKLIYDNIEDFKNGLALAFRNNTSFYIDIHGNEIWNQQ